MAESPGGFDPKVSKHLSSAGSSAANKAYNRAQQENIQKQNQAAQSAESVKAPKDARLGSQVVEEEQKAETQKTEQSAKVEKAAGELAEKHGGKAGAAVGGGLQGAVVGGVVSGVGAAAQEHGAGRVRDKQFEDQMSKLNSPMVENGAQAAVAEAELEEAHNKEKRLRHLKAAGHTVKAVVKGAVDGASGGQADGAGSAAAGAGAGAGALAAGKKLADHKKASDFADIGDSIGGKDSGSGDGDGPDKPGKSGSKSSKHDDSDDDSDGGKKKDGLLGGDDDDDDEKAKREEEAEQKESEKQPQEDNSDDGESDGAGGAIKKAGKAAGVAHGIQNAMAAAKLLEMLKMFLAMMQAFIQAAGAAIASLVSAIVNGVIAVASVIATAIGVSVAVAVGGLFAVVGLVIVAGVVVVSTYMNTQSAVRDDGFQCDPEDIILIDAGEVGGNTEANAKKVYDVFKAYGLSEENIAGVLGNWEHESGIDPTGVETIYTEPFQIGPRKSHAWQECDFKIAEFAPSYAARYPRIEYCGIGLGQWTNGRNRLLLDYASTLGSVTVTNELGVSETVPAEWYMLDVQLAFMISPSGDSRHDFFANWAPEGNPADAAKTFNVSWEGISYNPVRGQAAEKWFVRMAEWEADLEYGNSIVALAGATMEAADESAKTDSMDSCSNQVKPDNSTAAAAAVAYAWPTNSAGIGNNGTQLYQAAHDAIFPGDIWYMSCDRSVATAIRWSGTDDDFPAGAVRNQLQYLISSAKWQKVKSGGISVANLMPGDILIRSDDDVGHIVMYVGNPQIKAKYPDAPDNFCIVSGSYMERSPGCGVFYTGGGVGLDTYTVYRNVQKTSNSIYRGMTFPGKSGTE